MIEENGKLRPRKVRCVMTADMIIKADEVLKTRLYCVDVDGKLWKYHPGWDDDRVAREIGAVGYESGVATLRKKRFGRVVSPPKEKEAAPVEKELSLKDALAKIMKRLDKIEAAVEELAKAFR
jgi:hypothetical protein